MNEPVSEDDTPAYLQTQIRTMGVRCEHLQVDLSSADASQRIMDSVEAQLGPASILVNNATHDDLILWLAYKEAKAMIQFDEKKGERVP